MYQRRLFIIIIMEYSTESRDITIIDSESFTNNTQSAIQFGKCQIEVKNIDTFDLTPRL